MVEMLVKYVGVAVEVLSGLYVGFCTGQIFSS